jgi:hypothetical protein
MIAYVSAGLVLSVEAYDYQVYHTYFQSNMQFKIGTLCLMRNIGLSIGDWCIGDIVLHLPCMCRLYFTFTRETENNVS